MKFLQEETDQAKQSTSTSTFFVSQSTQPKDSESKPTMTIPAAIKIAEEVLASLSTKTESKFATHVKLYLDFFVIQMLQNLEKGEVDKFYPICEIHHHIFALKRLVLSDSETFSDQRFKEDLEKLVKIANWLTKEFMHIPIEVRNKFDFWEAVSDPKVSVQEASAIYRA